jgi:hypothetical protein
LVHIVEVGRIGEGGGVAGVDRGLLHGGVHERTKDGAQNATFEVPK